jgi:hypothetical protein
MRLAQSPPGGAPGRRSRLLSHLRIPAELGRPDRSRELMDRVCRVWKLATGLKKGTPDVPLLLTALPQFLVHGKDAVTRLS